MTGSDRPRNSGIRRAGLASSSPSVCDWRSPPMVLPIANRHGIAAYCTAFPIRKNVSLPTPADRPTYAKNRTWKIGPAMNVGMRIHGVSQLKSAR